MALMPLHCTSQRQYRNIVQNKRRTKTTRNFKNIFVHLNKMFSVVPLQTKANVGFSDNKDTVIHDKHEADHPFINLQLIFETFE